MNPDIHVQLAPLAPLSPASPAPRLFTVDSWEGGSPASYMSRIVDACGLESTLRAVINYSKLSKESRIGYSREGIVIDRLPGNRSMFIGLVTGRTMSLRVITKELREELREIARIVREDMIGS